MKLYSVALASLFAPALLHAQSTADLPDCAAGCVDPNLGGCDGIDVQCICSNTPLIASLACCVSKECSQADQEATIDFAQNLCQGQGVTDLPTTATCASTAAATETATGSTSTGATSPTVTGSSSSAGTSEGGNMASTTATTGGMGGGSGASTSSSAGAEQQTDNAASHERMGGVGLGMVVAGLVAAI